MQLVALVRLKNIKKQNCCDRFFVRLSHLCPTASHAIRTQRTGTKLTISVGLERAERAAERTQDLTRLDGRFWRKVGRARLTSTV